MIQKIKHTFNVSLRDLLLDANLIITVVNFPIGLRFYKLLLED